MSGGRAERERGLFDELRSQLRAALESMTGQAPEVSLDPLPSAPPDATFRWQQPLGSLPGAVWILAAESDWQAMGRAVLEAAGVEDGDNDTIRSTCVDIINQGLAGFAEALTSRLRREITATGGALLPMDAGDPPAAGRWSELHVQVGQTSFVVAVGLEDDLLEAIDDTLAPPEAAARRAIPAAAAGAAIEEAGGPEAMELEAEEEVASKDARGGSKTFDLLLEVELPVSVSFGRAQIYLKDVLKLGTGSVVELNRSISEPVEIIVNNCVIARGEVVVVEGNFGVRIQEVVSRQERLRTLR